MAQFAIHKGKSVWTEFLIILLGVLIAVGPYTLYPICDSSMHGDCYGTGVAEIVLGAILVLSGLFSLFIADIRKRELLWIILFIIPILSILFVTSITGTCESSMMACNDTGKPGIIAVGTIAVIAALFDRVLLINDKRRLG